MRNYNDPRYKAFRKAVKIRDRYTCQYPNCNKKKFLRVHHIIPWAHNYILRFDVKNGICLCKQHHDMVTKDEYRYIHIFREIIRRSQS